MRMFCCFREPRNQPKLLQPTLVLLLFLLSTTVIIGSFGVGVVDAFGNHPYYHKKTAAALTTIKTISLSRKSTLLSPPPPSSSSFCPSSTSKYGTTAVQRLSNSDNNNDNNDNDSNNNSNGNDGSSSSSSILDFELLLRRFEKADKMEIRNDATLVACYVLCRFLVYDITSGTKIEPGWNVQDFIWLSGTFSSATVLVVYYVVAGLLSRTYENNNSSNFGPTFPVLRSLVNVALCCPIWVATEHLFGFGPSNIGGDTLAVTVATGFIGFGSFMALAKTLLTSSGMR